MMLSGQLSGHCVLADVIASTRANAGSQNDYVLDVVRKSACGAHGITTASGFVITCELLVGSAFLEINQSLLT
jgi:hypothetical protein